jgi:hypothetical protein
MDIRFPQVIRAGLMVAALVPCFASAQTPFTGMAKPIDVAAGLQVGKGATDPQPNTVVFDCPRGDGRSGAKGILLKSNLGNGSTWSFKYIRNHENEGSVQIIHPVGRGQALITIRPKEILVDAPKLWAEAGWGGGEAKGVNEKAAFKRVFPLKDDQEYSIVSRVSTGGSFDLFVDGELVASGHTGAGKPLNLNIPPNGCRGCGKPPVKFGGADLPLVWSAGWAGVIVGPTDHTKNETKGLQFTPSMIDMPNSPAR